MDNISSIDTCYRKYAKNLNEWLPEGLINVDIFLLQDLDILSFYNPKNETGFTRYFQVVETDEKITLFNDQFIVWIVPEKIEDVSGTYVLIALNQPMEPKLEIAFYVKGVYNTSKMVLRVLDKMLKDIQENEELIHKMAD
jgi:hypothetical protein